MSYIRCGSNPESLYVFGNVNGNVDLSWTDTRGELHMVSCSNRQWNGLFRKIWRLTAGFCGISDEPISFGDGISIREVYYRHKTHSAISGKTFGLFIDRSMQAAVDRSDNKITHKEYQRILAETKSNFQIELRIGKQCCYMWRTTWAYLYNSVLSHLDLLNKRPPRK